MDWEYVCWWVIPRMHITLPGEEYPLVFMYISNYGNLCQGRHRTVAYWDLCSSHVGQLPGAQSGLESKRKMLSVSPCEAHAVTAVASSLSQLVQCMHLACLPVFTLCRRMTLFCCSRCHPWLSSACPTFQCVLKIHKSPGILHAFSARTTETSSLAYWAATGLSGSPVCRQL